VRDFEAAQHYQTGAFETFRRLHRGANLGQESGALGGIAKAHAGWIHAAVSYQAGAFQAQLVLELCDSGGVG